MEPYEILKEEEQSRDGAEGQDATSVTTSSSRAEDDKSHRQGDANEDSTKKSNTKIDLPPFNANVEVSFTSDDMSRELKGKKNDADAALDLNNSPLICDDESEDDLDDRDTQLLSGKSDEESRSTPGFIFVPKSAYEFGFGTSCSDPSLLEAIDHGSRTSPKLNGILEESLLCEDKEGSIASVEDSSLLEKENQAFILETGGGGILSGKTSKAGIFSDQLLGKESLLSKKSQGVKEKDKVPLLLPSPAKTEFSSEEESTMMSTSLELDSLRSPGLASDGEGEDQGVCSKYSQLSEDGSSPSSNMKTDMDHPGQGKDRVVFEHSLELGVAFSDYVDIDDFKVSLGSNSPHTEDGFGGKSEEHLLVLMKAGSQKALKTYLRQSQKSAESDTRHRLWENICTHLLKAGGNLYEELVKERFGNSNGEGHCDIPLPTFVDARHLHHHHLIWAGINSTRKILDIIGHFDPDVLYCPLLFPLAATFLHYMGPNSCFNCMQALLRSTDPTYMHQTKSSNDAVVFVLRDLAKKYTKQAFTLISRSSKLPESVFEHWMYWLFRDLPFQYLVRIIDCYLIEGYKVLYRMVLAVIYLFAKDIGKKGGHGSPVTDINAAISRFCVNMQIEPRKFLKVGFRIRGLTRKEIIKLQLKHQAMMKNLPAKDDLQTPGSIPSHGQVGLTRSLSGPVVLQSSGASILTQEMLQTLWSWIPHRFTLKKLVQLYTSEEHGTSLRTLFFKCEHAEHTFMVIKSTNNEIFGAYCSASWYERHEKNKPHTSFFGNGETFVFTLLPSEVKYAWSGLNPDQNTQSTADYFMAGDDNRLIVGGGGAEAIELDGMMNHCRTNRCDTFDNEPLCSSQDFSCRVVEIYGFVD